MPMTKARRHQLLLGWAGIALTWAASVVLEVVLLGSEAVLAVAVTTAAALIVGVQLTRRVMAPLQRATITVGDLRARLERR
jgi:hypothetical protein